MTQIKYYSNTNICQVRVVADLGNHIVWDNQGYVTSLRYSGLNFMSSKDTSSVIRLFASKLSRLQYYDSSGSQLVGTLPTEIGLMTNVIYFDISNNAIAGTIPTEIGLLNQLSTLKLYNTEIVGKLPSEIAMLSSLKILNVANNKKLNGTVPMKLTELVSLQYINISGTNLTYISQATRVPWRSTSSPTMISNSYLRDAPQVDSAAGGSNVGMIAGIIAGAIFVIIIIGAYVYRLLNGSSYCLFVNSKRDSMHAQNNGLAQYSVKPKPNIEFQNILSHQGIPSFQWCDIDLACDEEMASTANSSVSDNNKLISQKSTSRDKTASGHRDVCNIVIGEGSFGCVIKAQLIMTANKNSTSANSTDDRLFRNETTAIKIMRRKGKFNHFNYDEDFKMAVKEVRVHLDTENKIANKKCIVKVYGIVEGELPEHLSKLLNSVKAVGIVMQYAEGGALRNAFKCSGGSNPHLKTSLLLQSPNIVSMNYDGVGTGAGAGAVEDNTDHLAPSIHSDTCNDDYDNDKSNSITSSRSRSHNNSDIPIHNKILILFKIAQALAGLHRAGVYHGDIKPDNILLSSKDLSQAEIRLADFGLAEVRDKESRSYAIGASSFVETKRDRGTPIYCAPEQLYDPYKLQDNDNSTTSVMMYAKPSEKTDIYSFAILAWEVLSGQKPFPNVTSQVELSVQVHQGVRPDINQLPNDCPEAIRTMITTCWDHNRTNRKTSLECSLLLRQCYDQLTFNTIYDVYFAYRYDNTNKVTNRIRNKIMSTGLKVVWIPDDQIEDVNAVMRYDYISKSKVIVMCLDHAYQTDPRCISELQINQTLIIPRLVIPLLLEPQSDTFPNEAFKLKIINPSSSKTSVSSVTPTGSAAVKIFDISHTNQISFNISTPTLSSQPPLPLQQQPSESVAITPLEIELDSLAEYIYKNIKS